MSTQDLGARFVRFREHGDGSALAEVFDRTAPALLAIATHLTGRWQDAEDLVQATFVTAIERARKYDPRRPLLPWLAGILARHARNAARKRSRHETTGTVDVARPDPVLERLVSAEERAAFHEALEGLPSPYREVVRLRLQTGRSGREIGAELHRAPGTVRIQLHRGLELLRKALPPGLLAGAGLAVMPERGLAAIRAEVLRHAATVSVAGSGATVTVLGVVMSKTMLAVPAVLVLGVAAWWIGAPLLGEGPRQIAGQERASREVATVAPVAEPAPPSRVDFELGLTRSEASVGDAGRESTATRPLSGLVQVTGRVVEESSGRPVAGARVWVDSTELRDWEPPAGHALTGEDGRFTCDVEYWAVEQVQVWTGRHAYLSVHVECPAEALALRDGVDVGDLALFEGTRMRGRVLTHEGRPVANATVLLHQRESSNTFFPMDSLPLARSGPDGRFVAEHVPPTLFERSRLFAVAAEGIGAREVVIGKDFEELDDVNLSLAEPAELRVHVTDPDHQPLAEVRVQAVPYKAPYVWAWPGSDTGSLWLGDDPELTGLFERFTDEQGLAVFPFLPAGLPQIVDVTGEDHVGEHRQLRLKDRVTTEVIVLHPATDRCITGRVVDPDGHAVHGVHVQRHDWYQSEWSQAAARVEVGADGSFTLADVPAGSEWHLVVDAPGIAKTPVRVKVPADADLTDVELVAQEALSLRGVVRDDRGGPIAGAGVQLHRGEGEGLVVVHAVRPQTGEDGAFDFQNATQGEWTLKVYLPEPHDQWRRLALAIPVRADAGFVEAIAEREVAGQAVLDVTVVSATTGAPLTPTTAWYRFKEPDESGIWRSYPLDCEEGRAVQVGVKAGECVLHVEVAGHGAREQEFTVEPSTTQVSLRVELGRLATVSGRVVFDGVEPAGRLGIFANQDCQSVEPSGIPQTDVTRRYANLVGTDEFRFVEVPPGRLELTLAGGRMAGFVSLDVQPGEDHVVELHARPAGSLVTRGADRHPPSHLRIFLEADDGLTCSIPVIWPFSETARDVQTALPAGHYRFELLQSFGAGFDPVLEAMDLLDEGELIIEAGAATTLDIPPP